MIFVEKNSNVYTIHRLANARDIVQEQETVYMVHQNDMKQPIACFENDHIAYAFAAWCRINKAIPGVKTIEHFMDRYNRTISIPVPGQQGPELTTC